MGRAWYWRGRVWGFLAEGVTAAADIKVRALKYGVVRSVRRLMLADLGPSIGSPGGADGGDKSVKIGSLRWLRAAAGFAVQ